MRKLLFALSLLSCFISKSENIIISQEKTDFFHRQMENMMEEDQLPNAVIAVVQDSEILVLHGYGMADMEQQKEVDAKNTLFRVGSVSKIFTWTAIMQLAEEGLVNLDADIQQYLDFEIPTHIKGTTNEAGPVTLRHLLTHTSGFEDVLEGLFTLKPQPSLRDYLSRHIPARIFPAGQIMAYSNYNPVLAGYIIERISGISFEEYIKTRIFTPLGMTHSSFQQPLPENLNKNLVQAYRKVNEEFLPAGFEHMPAPAGGMSTTAHDMALFLAAHLNGGENSHGKFLESETLKKMHTPLFTYHPLLGGMTHGFKQFTLNGQQVIFHGGSTNIFDAGFYLLPDSETGIFIAYSGGNYAGHIKILHKFLNTFFPHDNAQMEGKPMIAAAAQPSLKELDGEYQQSRRIESTADKAINLMMGVLRVSITEDEMMEVKTLGHTLLFRELQPGIYENTTLVPFYPFGPMQYLIAEYDHRGRLMLTTDGPMTYIKMPWYATSWFAATLFIPVLALALGTLIFYFVRSFYRRISRKPKVAADKSFTARTFMVLHAFLLVFMLWLIAFTLNPHPVYRLPLSALGETGFANTLLSIMPWLIVATSLAMLYFSIQTWKDKLRKKAARIFYVIYSLFSLGLIWLFWYYNLLG